MSLSDQNGPAAELQLRPFVEADRELLVDYLNRPQVSHYLSDRIPQPYRMADADWWVREGSHSGYTRAIEVDGVLVGCVGADPGQFEFRYTAEAGYWLADDYWGLGYATQALGLLMAELQSQTDLQRLQATVFVGNEASVRVLQRCGFVQEAHLKKAVFKHGQFADALLFGRLLR